MAGKLAVDKCCFWSCLRNGAATGRVLGLVAGLLGMESVGFGTCEAGLLGMESVGFGTCEAGVLGRESVGFGTCEAGVLGRESRGFGTCEAGLLGSGFTACEVVGIGCFWLSPEWQLGGLRQDGAGAVATDASEAMLPSSTLAFLAAANLALIS